MNRRLVLKGAIIGALGFVLSPLANAYSMVLNLERKKLMDKVRGDVEVLMKTRYKDVPTAVCLGKMACLSDGSVFIFDVCPLIPASKDHLLWAYNRTKDVTLWKDKDSFKHRRHLKRGMSSKILSAIPNKEDMIKFKKWYIKVSKKYDYENIGTY